MTPHQTDLLQGLDLAEVEDGLGGEGAGEAAGDVDLPQCPPLRLAVNQIRESVVTELLLRERLRSEADTEVGEVVAVSTYQADGVVITEVIQSHSGQVGQFGEEHCQLWLPVRLRQLEQEAESSLEHKTSQSSLLDSISTFSN